MPEFEKLAVWREAHELAVTTYRATRDFPIEERFGLTSQMRRAAIAMPANIAEGKGRGTDSEFAPFVRVAVGSAFELQALTLLARDVDLLDPDTAMQMVTQAAAVIKMLTLLLRRLQEE